MCYDCDEYDDYMEEYWGDDEYEDEEPAILQADVTARVCKAGNGQLYYQLSSHTIYYDGTESLSDKSVSLNHLAPMAKARCIELGRNLAPHEFTPFFYDPNQQTDDYIPF